MDPENVKSLDIIHDGLDDSDARTYRETGILVNMEFKFTNENTFGTSKTYYMLSTSAEKGTSYNKLTMRYRDNGGREVFWRAGIQFRVKATSDRLIMFSTSQLLSALTAALVLLGVSTQIVEKIMFF